MTHVWHPGPLHAHNRPGVTIEFSQEPYPFRCRRLIVSAAGVIDACDESEEDQ